MKARVLAIEGVDLERLTRLASKRTRFIGSHAAKIFCLPACRFVPRGRGPRAAHFATLRDARRSGYRPCGRCRLVSLTVPTPSAPAAAQNQKGVETMRIWRDLSYLALSASFVSLGIAYVSWMLVTRLGGLSPRAYAAGAGIAVLYAIAFMVMELLQRKA